jgi:hypothetical protein
LRISRTDPVLRRVLAELAVKPGHDLHHVLDLLVIGRAKAGAGRGFRPLVRSFRAS